MIGADDDAAGAHHDIVTDGDRPQDLGVDADAGTVPDLNAPAGAEMCPVFDVDGSAGVIEQTSGGGCAQNGAELSQRRVAAGEMCPDRVIGHVGEAAQDRTGGDLRHSEPSSTMR